jgi:hypothetical protein
MELQLTEEQTKKIIETYMKNKEYAKKYYKGYQQTNKEKINAYNLMKYHENKEKCCNQKKEYYEKNKEMIKKKSLERYYQKKQKEIKE